MDKQAIAFTPIGRVVMVSDTTSIREMILLCHNKGIQSCPVYTGAKEDNNYIGIVSVLHVVRRMMASFAQPSGIQEVDEDNLSDSDEVEIDFAALPSEFVSDPVGSLPLDSFEPIHEGAMLQDVMKRMVDHKLKRIPVLSSSGKLVNFVSESLLIRQLAAQPELLGELADMDLEDALEEAIGDEEQQVVSVSAEDSVSEAFEILSDKGFNAVPVLGEGQFLGEITIRQAYQISIASNKMRLLNMSCRQFVAYCNRRRKWDVSTTVLQVDYGMALRDVLTKLSTARKRRVYVCNGAAEPVRIVSLSDLLAACCRASRSSNSSGPV